MQSGVYWRTDGACNGEFLDEMEAMHGGSSPGLIHPTFTQHLPLMLAHHCHQAVLVSITSVLQWFLCPSITLVMQTWSMMNNTEQLSYPSKLLLLLIIMNSNNIDEWWQEQLLYFQCLNTPKYMTNFTLACCSLGASTLSTLSSILSLFYLSWLCILWEFYYFYDSMNTRMQKWHQIALD